MKKIFKYWVEALLILCALLWLAGNARCERKITDYSCTAQLHTEPDGTQRFWVSLKLWYDDGTLHEQKKAIFTAEPVDGKNAIRNARHKAEKECSKLMDATEDEIERGQNESHKTPQK